MAIIKCEYCGKEYYDTHPGRKGKKFCCREHWKEYINKNGTWNKGKSWELMYEPNVLEQLKKRINSKGENHFNYNKARPDVWHRNLLNNSSRTEEENKVIQERFKEEPEKTIKELMQKAIPRKESAYQRKAFKKYGRICQMCGKNQGQIDVHHKDNNHRNNQIQNLMVLCASCHSKLHKRKALSRGGPNFLG